MGTCAREPAALAPTACATFSALAAECPSCICYLRLSAALVPCRFMDEFSTDFEAGFLRTLSTVWGVRRVGANKVYNEYIKDKLHVHMNTTVWSTLSLFVEYLGRMGKVIIDKTEEGYFVTFIDKDPEKERRNREALEQIRMDEDKEQRHAAKLDAEARERAKALDVGRAEATGLERDDAAAPVSVTIRPTKARLGGLRMVTTGSGFGGSGAAAAAASSAGCASSSAPGTATGGRDSAAAGEAGRAIGGIPALADRWGAGASGPGGAAAAPVDGAARAPKRQRWESAAEVGLTRAPASTATSGTAGAPTAAGGGAALDMAAAVKRAKLAAARLSGRAVEPGPTSTGPRLPGMAGLFRDIEASKQAAAPSQPPTSDERAAAAEPTGGPAAPPAVVRRRMERGAMVRIQNESVEGGRFHRCKGTVTRVKEAEGTVVVKVRGSGERLVLPVGDIETLVPRAGGQAIGLAGAVHGQRLTVTACDVDAEVVSVKVEGSGATMARIPFDAVAKLDVEYFESKVSR